MMYSKQQGSREPDGGGTPARSYPRQSPYDRPTGRPPVGPLGRPPVGPPDRPPSGRQPSYRQPARPRLQVPPNYSGHAIVDGEERLPGVVEERRGEETAIMDSSTSGPAPGQSSSQSPGPGSGAPVPRFDDLPRVSRSGEPTHRATPSAPALPAAVAEDGTPPPAPETPSRPLFGLRTFPFGHGLGTEELLLVGLILLLWWEGDTGEEQGDLYETLLLLGLLLLLG